MTKTPEELTEDWKAGKLPAGDYYIKFENGEIERQNNCIGGFLMSCNNRVVQILAPVPSFEEWQDGIFNFNILKMSLNGFEKREKQLKELLKECKTRMTDCLYKLYDEGGQSYPNLDEELKSLLTKIEEC